MNNGKSDICESRKNIALVQFKLVIMDTNDGNGLYKSALSTNVFIPSWQDYYSCDTYILVMDSLEALFVVYKRDQNSWPKLCCEFSG